ncbi:nuclear factor of activated T-cells, cytoplasmic 1 isoform X3 [Prionailurus bengalensis]|uniref:nuclear factor of activated T-cells, cytoplasmic 1 isoform X3 n=1 Tax=Prionailurus bengalensis TaxID=37029 RepID=UPI001CA8B3B9|nr:nuclear factor of activated T-cells, cytoplasmic 1 isoform X3 [Prionailurus bengalensis]
MSRQGGGAGAAGPAGRRGRCFPALKRQEAERGPASERHSEDSELAGTVTAPGRAAGRGHRGAGAHRRAPATPPPRHAARAPGPRLGPPRAHTPPNDICPGRAALSRGRGPCLPGRPGRGGGAERLPLLLPLLLLPAAAAAAAAWMPSTSFPVPSKFPLGPPAAVCGSGETLGPAPPSGGTMKSAEEEHYSYAPPSISTALPPGSAHPSLPALCHDLQSAAPGMPGAAAGQPPGYGGAVDSGPSSYLLSSGHIRPNGAPALESPRIEITSYMGLHHGNNQFFHDVEVGDVIPSSKRPPSTATLNLPNLEAYRDPSCLSPASSLSSRSCNSEASSYESNFSYPYASPQTSPWQSPCVSPKTTDPEEGFPRGLGACGLLGSPRHSPSTSPRTSVTEESWLGARTSRPSSPCNKRKYGLNGRQLSCSPHHSPTPSPRSSPRVSVTDDTWLGNSTQYTSSAIVAAINALSTDSTLELGDGVPVKARKTALDRCPSVALKVEPAGEDLGATPPTSEFLPEEVPPFQHIRKGAFCDQYLSVPQHPYQWARPRSPTSYTSPSLPALDWQVPSRSGPYELRIEVQPKPHHRAHYETEGSRGAVKASAGGHPSVQLHGYLENEPLTLQLFIGTADDRLLRPHAFYQVHRITGKTVSTTSHEAILSNTKVLEIPLLPENNMRAIVDCAGILKLRNSDIELRKGETDIGRKNTRVRLVFRVHIPQPNGRTLSLQVASNPIECSQRSAQELPLVEKQSAASCPVLGGKKMVLSGHNFLQDSKVIFVEKAPEFVGGRDTAIPQSENNEPRPSQFLRLQREEEEEPVSALDLPSCERSNHKNGARRRPRACPDLWARGPGPEPAPAAALQPAARGATRPGLLPGGRLPALSAEKHRGVAATRHRPGAPRPVFRRLRQGHGQPGPRPPWTSAAGRRGARRSGDAEACGRAPRAPPAATPRPAATTVNEIIRNDLSSTNI